MGRPLGSKNKPAEGGAVGVGETDQPQVRGPIKDMLAGGSDEDFKASLPEQTSTDGEGSLEPPTPRKKRRTKAEMAASRGGEAQPVDKRLERAQSKMTGLGAAGLVTAGFTMSGKPLDEEEKEDVGDQFYLISKKMGGNSESWIFIILYTIALLAKLVIIRTEAGEEFQKWLKNTFMERNKENERKSQSGTQA